MTAAIFTIGHGTRSLDEFIDILASADIALLVDVRRFPGSRRHPHFSREELERSVPLRQIAYEWRGEELGGRRSRAANESSRHPAWRNAAFQGYADHMDTPEFRDAITRLEQIADERGPLAIMCAESLWWRCHRRMISDTLVMRGVPVVHLMNLRARQEHPLNPAARPDDAGFPIYDVGTTATLDV